MKTSGTYAICGHRRAWILWDLDNGDSRNQQDSGKGYVWVFKTKKDALTHRVKQHKMKYGARLSKPIKIEYPR